MLFDHLFVLFIAVVFPVVGYFSFRRLVRRFRAGEAIDRLHLYHFTMVVQWILFLAVLVLWAVNDRPWPLLGFGFGFDADAGLLGGIALTVAAVVFLVMQLRQVASANDDDLRKFRGQAGDLALMLPHDRREFRGLVALSVTAGIVEETLWRGFLIWYLAQWMPLWAAGVASAVGFGLAHAYQGASNVPRLIVVGGVFVALYLMTGSLWLPMLMHAVVDILQGRLAFELFSGTRGDAATFKNPPAASTDGAADHRTPLR